MDMKIIADAFGGDNAPLAVLQGCELAVKEKDGKLWFFVLNYSAKEQGITVKKPMTDLDTGEEVFGHVMLAPYETKVYR